MPTYEDPGLFCKLCCPYCAVYQANGCVCPQMLMVYCFGFCYTMCCWVRLLHEPDSCKSLFLLQRLTLAKQRLGVRRTRP